MSETIGPSVSFEGRLLVRPERDHVEALDGRFPPASKRKLQILARLGIEEIPADEIELLPRKARRRDGSSTDLMSVSSTRELRLTRSPSLAITSFS